ncbi:MAG: bifunctional phosphoglucose/phosphomannose isomerase [Candidatus Thermoplasmatota archaeon]|nr:bifunctional phosphoglucose/phosphomannose isomerase [Candidatus Thermoplasmatota archaeon]
MDMQRQILELKEQVLSRESLPVDISRYDSIVVAGMGGSGVTSLILSDLYQERPVFSVMGYDLPKFVDKKSLFIAVSYSGNTEETLSCLEQALERGCDAVAITSGGKLLERGCDAVAITSGGKLAERCSDRIMVPAGIQPRSALGYMVMPLINTFLGLTDADRKRISDAIAGMFRRENEIRTHARRIVERKMLPVFIGDTSSRGVVTRWRTQINENSKLIAYSCFLPEANHNDTVWMANRSWPEKDITVLSGGEPRIEKRIRAMEKLTGLTFNRISHSGGVLERNFAWIAYGDMLSYHIAVERGVDPEDVSVLTRLKNEIA